MIHFPHLVQNQGIDCLKQIRGLNQSIILILNLNSKYTYNRLIVNLFSNSANLIINLFSIIMYYQFNIQVNKKSNPFNSKISF